MSKPTVHLGDDPIIGAGKRIGITMPLADFNVSMQADCYDKEAAEFALANLAIAFAGLTGAVHGLQRIVASMVPLEDPLHVRTAELQGDIDRLYAMVAAMRR